MQTIAGPINPHRQTIIEKVFEYFIVNKENDGKLLIFMRFLANQNSVTRRTITFTSENYYLAVVPVNPSFEDQNFSKREKATIEHMLNLCLV